MQSPIHVNDTILLHFLILLYIFSYNQLLLAMNFHLYLLLGEAFGEKSILRIKLGKILFYSNRVLNY